MFAMEYKKIGANILSPLKGVDAGRARDYVRRITCQNFRY